MPDTSIAIAIMLGSFAILLMLRMPISFTLGISSVLTAPTMMLSKRLTKFEMMF